MQRLKSYRRNNVLRIGNEQQTNSQPKQGRICRKKIILTIGWFNLCFRWLFNPGHGVSAFDSNGRGDVFVVGRGRFVSNPRRRPRRQRKRR
jgi:hypothetical protein